MKQAELISTSDLITTSFGEQLGKKLSGGELIELTGDLGSGKTTFLKGIAKGLGITQPISSPTFTISRVYQIGDKRFHHFDFYRIDSSDIVALEIAEAVSDPKSIVAVEWAEHIKDSLPKEYLSVSLKAVDEGTCRLELTAYGPKHEKLLEQFS